VLCQDGFVTCREVIQNVNFSDAVADSAVIETNLESNSDSDFDYVIGTD
jgi:hypothetical protein